MLKIKHFHFFIVFIIITIIGTFSFNNIILIIQRNLFITLYGIYIINVIPKLNNIYKSLDHIDLKIYKGSILLLLIAILYSIYSGFETYNFDGFELYDYYENNILLKTSNFALLINFFIILPYFLTKTIVSVEQRKVIKVSDYFKEFIFAIITPIFIYKMVPRINQIYENSVNGDIFVNQNENVYLTLTKNEALVFFEFLCRLNEQDNKELFEYPAEEKVLLSIEAELEKSLSEPFSPNYIEILQKAREELGE